MEPMMEKKPKPPLTVAQWLARALPTEDYLLGHLLSTTSRVLFSADSGAGKTMLALALAVAMALGRGFLRWRGRRQARVLYIDGEMPRIMMQDRLRVALKWFGVKGEDLGLRLKVLSAEDYEEMPPLDDVKGQQWLDQFIDREGPFDVIIFDNLQALTALPLKEEEGWLAIARWARTLTKRRIGQLWVHHVGKDAARGDYGTSIKRWGMDTIMLGAGSEGPAINMQLTFSKARGARPGTFNEFTPLRVMLTGGGWCEGEAGGGRPNVSTRVALRALAKAVDGTDALVPRERWQRMALRFGISKSSDAQAQARAFARAVDKLIEQGVVEEYSGDQFRLVSL
jgi:hypothetical protein